MPRPWHRAVKANGMHDRAAATCRLGRSLADLIGSMQELRDATVDLFIHQQGLDTTTASGRAMFGMLGVFSEFERAMIQARVKAGLERAKQEQMAGKVRRDARYRATMAGNAASVTPI